MLAGTFSFAGHALGDGTNALYNFSRDRVLYEVGYSHLDTQYRWAFPQVVREFLPNTVRSNVVLFQEYPDYIFNWTGANRYRLMQEYHPEDFATVRRWVASGRWFSAGNSWEENDVDIPSPESLIRQVMFGHDFFKKVFGTESSEYFDPDAFGYPASLPSVLAHCGIRGFSTAKLAWGPAVPIPFNVGEWIGPDGNSVIAALNPGPYNSPVTNNLSTDPKWLERLNQDGAKSGLFVDYAYYGVGDTGGAPVEDSVQWIEKSIHTDGPVHVISSRADQMFNDISDAQKKQLPKYKGDLLLTEITAGSVTSQAYMKKWNRDNEMLANEAETAAVAANLLGGAAYPREKLHHAWELVLANQFHDTLPGTALPKAYEYAWNDEIIAMNCFAEVLRDSVGAGARALNTQTTGRPLVVYNPISIARQDIVEASLEFAEPPSRLQVYDADGKPVPTQLLLVDGNVAHFLFLADVDPMSFTVFSVKESPQPAPDSSLQVTEHSLENARYRITINDNGDISSIFDKVSQRDLLSAPSRLEFLTQCPSNYPSWDMDWKDQSAAPRGFVDGPADIRVVENGPVRVAVQIKRKAENSIFTLTIRLAAGDAGDHIEVENHVDWQSRECSLKADFPLTVSNSQATYNWDLGKIQRGNDNPQLYEVPSHQWFDLTDSNGQYGVSILCPTKYGSDKPSDDELRLTLLYTPGVQYARFGRYQEQKTQDWGLHDFVYGIYGHTGDWRAGKSDWQSTRLNQPLLAFSTASHTGPLGHSFSMLKLNSDAVAVRSVKLAENDDKVIVRLQELNGTPESYVHLSTTGLKNAVEVNGLESSLHPLPTWLGLWLDFKPYQIRSLALTLGSPLKMPPPGCQSVVLPYDFNALGVRGEHTDGGGLDGNGNTIPAEMIGNKIVSEGIPFQIAVSETLNGVTCRGQTISLPPGQFNELYLLAAAGNADTNADFSVDGTTTTLRIQKWTGYIGQWDNRKFAGYVPEMTYTVNNPVVGISPGYIKRAPLGWFCSHRRLADGSDAFYSYSYLFKYRIPIQPDAQTLTLPDNPDIRIIAATVSQNDNELTQPAQPLYDDFDGREPIQLRDTTPLATQ